MDLMTTITFYSAFNAVCYFGCLISVFTISQVNLACLFMPLAWLYFLWLFALHRYKHPRIYLRAFLDNQYIWDINYYSDLGAGIGGHWQ